MNAIAIQSILPRLLFHVEKPARYTGGELNQVVKDWNAIPVRLALVFPEIYDLGMSNLGLAVLYDIVNHRSDFLAERAFLPWSDMEAAMRREDIPLYSLETKHPVAEFDVVGISLPYESLYTNALHALDLAGIPLRGTERVAGDPLVIAGGHATFNPEPMAEFIDAFAIGEGEEVIIDILETIRRAKTRGASRAATIADLAGIEGVYVPSFYAPVYAPDGTVQQIQRTSEAAKAAIKKRIVAPLPPAPIRPIVPYTETVHDRYAIEIMRGCTRGCRFCQAGSVTRPVRERTVRDVMDSIEQALAHTGYEEVALLSLSSSDYSHITSLVDAIAERFGHSRLRVSLPSLRIESVSLDLVDALRGRRSPRAALSGNTTSQERKRDGQNGRALDSEGAPIVEDGRSAAQNKAAISGGGFTLAPEAATERMRGIINKPLQTEQLLAVAREIYGRKWTTIKLYFMIGQPQETIEDVRAIAGLCHAVLAEGRRALGRRAEVHAGVSTFIPKPHTPFQWAPMDDIEQIRRKQDLLRRELRGPGLRLDWSDPEETLLEGRLARGDRRMGDVIYRAWRNGARFDAWRDRFRAEAWQAAFTEAGIDPAFYTQRERTAGEIFPWDHISTGVRKAFLRMEYERSRRGETIPDCRGECFACGILPAFRDLRSSLPEEVRFCQTAPET